MNRASHTFSERWLFALLLSVVFAMALGVGRAAELRPDGVVIVEIEGNVEVLGIGQTLWREGRTNQVLNPGERFRTQKSSRATLRLSDRSQLRVGQLSEFQVTPPPGPEASSLYKLWRGVIYLFHRGKPGEFRFDTQTASAAVRGTEFTLMVDEAGRTVLTVLEGEVLLSNSVAGVEIRTGEQAIAQAGQRPVVTALLPIQQIDAVQWVTYYPGILNLPDAGIGPAETTALADSLRAWAQGDLVAALKLYPADRVPATEAERIYRAALLLAAGQVDSAETLLQGPLQDSAKQAVCDSLHRIIAVVKGAVGTNNPAPGSATEWLVESYARQAQHDLPGALGAAREAVQLAPEFAFGLAHLAELEFSFGHINEANEAVEKALKLSPRNAEALALKGFLAAARNNPSEAIGWFDRAIAVDGALGNAWLGRGLCKIRQGHLQAGLLDLQTAATVEPQRSVFRSYLGKAYAQQAQRVFSLSPIGGEGWGEGSLAGRELDMAARLDPNDPTPWLYRALLDRSESRINPAVSDLERSMELNDNRAVYRSRLLLDEDSAVRGANLARVYQDAGMNEVSLREAARAVSIDYANSSAHLFLADSFDALRDPTRFNLRYETIWANELLLGNLLAPVGAGHLSQHISQQEYSRLFEANRLTLFNSTEYRSDGQWREIASQSGLYNNTAYALDLDYQHNRGIRPNNELNRIDWYSTIKHEITPQDSLLAIVRYQDYHSGDNFQYYDPAQARPNLTVDANQAPTIIAGYHREWRPGIHTLLLGGRLESDQRVSDSNATNSILLQDFNGNVVGSMGLGFDLNYRSRFETYLAEAQQIFQSPRQALILGGRYQWGEFRTFNRLNVSDPNSSFYTDGMPEPTVTNGFSVTQGFERLSGYGYYTVEPIDHLRATAGLSYDTERYPVNFRQPPISAGQAERDRFGPKAALLWSPLSFATLRFAYTRSLGGVSFDESVRLEPSQLAGFGQAYRTIISESVAGSVSAPTFETFGAALDLKLSRQTYLTWQGELLNSQVRRQLGLFTLPAITPIQVAALRENLDYEEKSLSVALNHLAGDWWSLGALYKLTDSRLDSTYPELAATLAADRHESALLHQAQFYALFQHPSGFFARAETQWYAQHNTGYATPLPGDDFFQHNVYLGYRILHRRGEILFGVLNLIAQDYRLNPLNPYFELPRDRVFYARLRLDF